MSVKVEITDTDGTVRTFTLPAFKALTVAQWADLCQPTELKGLDLLYEEIKRITKIPKKLLRRLPPGELDRLTTAILELRKEAEAGHAQAQDLAGRWAADGPDTIDHDGVTYTVPKDLERDTIAGQWMDLNSLLKDGEHDAAIYAAICACLLVPEGKEYEGYHKALDAMQTLPASEAMAIAAFFLQRSERLRTSISLSMAHRVMSLQQGQGQAETSTMHGGEAGIF